MLDHRILTFITLYKEMNYRKTAQLLNMTQPGVTQHIHHLEEFYGVKLFSYTGRQLTRTRQAELLKRHLTVCVQRRLLCGMDLYRRTVSICGWEPPRPSENLSLFPQCGSFCGRRGTVWI